MSMIGRLVSRQRERVVRAIGQHEIPGLFWLIEGFNFYDRDRVKAVGADRAAAEWIVRCEGTVRFNNEEKPYNDYNLLLRRTSMEDSNKPDERLRIVAIDATDASVTGYGCRHLSIDYSPLSDRVVTSDGLKHLEDLRFVRCRNLLDFGLEISAQNVGDHLRTLRVVSCPRITERGLHFLSGFRALDTLLLHDLPNVENPTKVAAEVRAKLPETCDFRWPGVLQ